MKWTLEHDVVWPTSQQWSQFLAVHELTDHPDRTTPATSIDPRTPLELTHGEWFAAGSQYSLCLPHDTCVMSGRGEIDHATVVRVDAALASDPKGAVTARLDRLAQPTAFTTTSTLRYLTWQVRADLVANHVVAAQIHLRWLSAHVDIRRRGSTLRLDVRVHGRGIWRPVVWAMAKFMLRLDDEPSVVWAELCSKITAIARDEAAAPDREEASPEQLESDVEWPNITKQDLDLRYLRNPIASFRYFAARSSHPARPEADLGEASREANPYDDTREGS